MRIRTLGLLTLVGLSLALEHAVSDAPTRVHIARLLTFYPAMIALPWLAWASNDMRPQQRFALMAGAVIISAAGSLAGSLLSIAKIEFVWYHFMTSVVGVVIGATLYGATAFLIEVLFRKVAQAESRRPRRGEPARQVPRLPFDQEEVNSIGSAASVPGSIGDNPERNNADLH